MHKIYLVLTYDDKEHVKSLGAKWDVDHRLWYTYSDNPHIKKLKKYIHVDDYDKCGIESDEDKLNKLLMSFKRNKSNA